MHLCEYRGFQIDVDENGWFKTKYGEGEFEGYSADSLANLKERIDQYRNREAKARKLSLPVILPNGQKATATGIHLSRGTILGLPGDDHHVYPDVDWVIATLDRLRLLRQEINRTQERIRPYQITTHRGSIAKSEQAEVYAQMLDKLEQEYADKKTAALKDENVEETC